MLFLHFGKQFIFENAFWLELFNRSPTLLKPNIQLINTNFNNYNIFIIFLKIFIIYLTQYA